MTRILPDLSLRQQLDAHRAWVKHLGWITKGGIVLAGASMLLPLLFSQLTLSLGVRAGIALGSGVLAVGAVVAARWPQWRLAEFESAMSDLVEQARDLKARAASDPIARAAYVAYLRDTREELVSVPQRLRGYGTEKLLLPALEAVDAEIASYEALDQGASYPSVAAADETIR